MRVNNVSYWLPAHEAVDHIDLGVVSSAVFWREACGWQKRPGIRHGNNPAEWRGRPKNQTASLVVGSHISPKANCNWIANIGITVKVSHTYNHAPKEAFQLPSYYWFSDWRLLMERKAWKVGRYRLQILFNSFSLRLFFHEQFPDDPWQFS
jgi:hypothetical protein